MIARSDGGGAGLLLVDALTKASKKFNMLVMPNRNHDYFPDDEYLIHRIFDYFVEHLWAIRRKTASNIRCAAIALLIVTIAIFHCSKGNAKTQESYIDVTGGRVWHKAVGIDKEGIILLILRGGPGAPHDYLEPLEALSDERPVIFYEQLVCSNSDIPDDSSLWTVERFVDELGQVREALGLDDALFKIILSEEMK